MASSPLEMTPDNAVDVSGMSVFTALPSGSDYRAGSIYDPALSAVMPVCVTPLDAGDHLLLFSRRWVEGVPSATTPGHYTSYTINNAPGWMVVDPAGARRPVDGSYDIPMTTPHDAATMVSAVGLPPYSTYILNTVSHNGITTAVVQQVFWNPAIKTLSILAEEAVPNAYLGAPPVSLVYNLPGIDNLILTPDVVAKIFAGTITSWNHSSIASINTGITLPSLPITVIHVDDACATTEVFQSWLATNSNWPHGSGATYGGVGTGATGTYGAVEAVEATAGSITYAEKPLAAQILAPSARFGVTPVLFDRGLWLFGQHLAVFGATDDGRVCLARKEWGRVGVPFSPWEYYTGTGWSTDITEVRQCVTTTGGLTTVGPISAATFSQNRVRMVTTTASGTSRYGQVHSLTNALEWKVAGTPILIGSTADGSYQGGTLYLQSQLRVVESIIDTPDSVTAIPYLHTRKVFGTGSSALRNYWAAWQVSRLY